MTLNSGNVGREPFACRSAQWEAAAGDGARGGVIGRDPTVGLRATYDDQPGHGITVAGAGLIGKRHVEEVAASPDGDVGVDRRPGPGGAELADKFRVAHRSLAELFAADKPDGVILATPNPMHVEGGLECVAGGVPVIVEKLIGDTVECATRLVEAGEAAGVPVLTGHHRNYCPSWPRPARSSAVERLGPLVAVVGTALFYKPDDYFDEGGGWRRGPAAARSCSTSPTR